MFGMFQRRDPRSEADSGNHLVSFIGMNRGGRGLSIREKLAVAHRIDTVPPLDNPLSALDISQEASGVAPSMPAPVLSAAAVLLPVSFPSAPPTSPSTPSAGGLTW